jgi:hypothetical protein
LFFGTGDWTPVLHLEPLHQPFFCEGFFQDRVSQTICPHFLWTAILLLSASGVARIIGFSYRCPAGVFFVLFCFVLCDWGLNSGLHTWKTGAHHLSHTSSLAPVILEMVSCELFPWANFKPQSSLFQPPK